MKVASTAELDGSNDYKVVYLTIGKETVPGTVNLSFTKGKTSRKSALRAEKRTWNGNDNPGFDASDVLLPHHARPLLRRQSGQQQSPLVRQKKKAASPKPPTAHAPAHAMAAT